MIVIQNLVDLGRFDHNILMFTLSVITLILSGFYSNPNKFKLTLLSYVYVLLTVYLVYLGSTWSHKPNDNIIRDHIKWLVM
jgi:predicted neutral ceramidase superfamily lipid hydrolase